MGRKKIVKEKDLLKAIPDSGGYISTIASRLECSWNAANNAIKASPAALEALRAEEEIKLDFVEGQAMKRIKEGDGSMIRFYLATKGKRRGFTYEENTMNREPETDTEINIEVAGGEPDPVTPCADEIG